VGGLTRAKRHHTVPRFYLRRFADDRDRLLRLDKRTAEAVQLRTKDATVVVDFYTITTDDGPSDVIERRLSEIESKAATALRRIEHGVDHFDVDDLAGLSNFIAIQATRGPEFRDALNKFTDEVIKKMMFLQSQYPESVRQMLRAATGQDPSEVELQQAIEMMSTGRFQAQMHPTASVSAMLEAAAPLVEIIAQMNWQMYSAPEPVFFTSDRPVSLWAEDSAGPFYGIGFLTADEITLPLDPYRCLMLTHRGGATGQGRSPRELDERTLSGAVRWIFGHASSEQLPLRESKPSASE